MKTWGIFSSVGCVRKRHRMDEKDRKRASLREVDCGLRANTKGTPVDLARPVSLEEGGLDEVSVGDGVHLEFWKFENLAE